ncbi:MAG: energy transducer TonB [Bacteroidia bacterium]|nr:energy transducer TonB [Bacteroidia bacterium]
MVNWFSPYYDYFWEWDSESYACVRHGHTIVHYAELIRLMIDQGSLGGQMPSIGTQLLVLHAMNDTWEKDKDGIHQLFKSLYGAAVTSIPSIEFLETLARLPKQYKTGSKRDDLFFLICNHAHRKYNYKKINKAVQTLRTVNLPELAKRKGDFPKFEDAKNLEALQREFPTSESLIKALEDLPELGRITQETLISKKTTSNTGLPVPEKLLPYFQQSELFQLAALVPYLSATLNKHSSKLKHGDQSSGGLADISQKGRPDRLLVSEFAYDDHTFLTRIANGEALYYHNENPESKQTFTRTFLIDSSLPAWGNPRLLAFAIALSMEIDPKKNAQHAFFTLGNGLNQFFPEHPIGLVEALKDLSLNESPLPVLESWSNEYNAVPGNEVFLFVEKGQLQEPNFLHFLQNNRSKINYLGVCDSGGQFERYRITSNGRHLEQELRIHFNTHWKNYQGLIQKQDHKTNQASDFPLLIYPFAEPVYIDRFSAQEYWHQTKDGLLVCNKRLEKQGAKKSKEIFTKGWKQMYGPIEEKICSMVQHPKLGLIGLTHHPIKLKFCIQFFEQEKKTTPISGNCISKEFKTWYKDEKFYVKTPTELLEFGLDGSFKKLEQETEVPHYLISNWGFDPKTYFKKKQYSKVKAVFINRLGNLCFDRYEMLVTNNGILSLIENPESVISVAAQGNYQNGFQFENGFQVKFIPGNQVMLKWPNQEEKNIVFPLIPDFPLAAFSQGKYCGNPYFFEDGEVMENRNFYQRFIQPWLDEILGNKQQQFIEIVPAYEGGMEQFNKEFLREFKLPFWSKLSNTSGRVVLKFEIKANGTIENTQIETGINEAIDAEVLRAFACCKNWKPGTQNGIPVSCKMTLPIRINT